MARPLRVLVPDGTYHVFSRGNGHQSIFLDDRDRHRFIQTALEVKSRFDWRVLTYSLLGNHYHLVVRTPSPTLSRAVRQLNGVHAQRFNRRHDRDGHLFGGRFKAVLVQTDGHLLELARYVALNPVRAGLADRPQDWPWSAHRGLVGMRADELLDARELLSYFGPTFEEGRKRYLQAISEADPQDLPDPDAVIAGTQEFIATHLPSGDVSAEVPSRQLPSERPPLSEILEQGESDEGISRAYREHGYLLKEIAEALGCHYSTVSRRLRRHEAGSA